MAPHSATAPHICKFSLRNTLWKPRKRLNCESPSRVQQPWSLQDAHMAQISRDTGMEDLSEGTANMVSKDFPFLFPKWHNSKTVE